ncbi:MAG: glycosyltransferase family 2 protein [Candidatus Marsarchaeota archaeon]|nr:glycosyltransferase family 2 protein [Candidatus Marsarchaeota archaeon]
MDYTISGFMNVWNVKSQGYPFIQAIESALPICDEFLVSDGYSTDGTWEELLKLQKKHNKIKLYRKKWVLDKKTPLLTLANSANQVRVKCKGSYILYIQANEIIHEKSIQTIKKLPEMYPTADLFNLPFNIIFGTNLLDHTEYRTRLARNLRYINVIQDAWTLGYSYENYMNRFKITLNFFMLHFMLNLFNPNELKKLFSMIFISIIKIGFTDTYRVQFINLEEPIYRYSSLKPEAMIKKLEGHTLFWNASVNSKLSSQNKIKEFLGMKQKKYASVIKTKDYAAMVLNNDKKHFWSKMVEYNKKNEPYALGDIKKLFKPMPIEKHPKIIQPTLKKAMEEK